MPIFCMDPLFACNMFYDMKAATKQIRLKKIPLTLVGIEPGPPG